MMRLSVWITAFILYISSGLVAQQLPGSGQYNYHGFVFNPAMTGWEHQTSVAATYRHQWTSMVDGPRSGTVNWRRFVEDKNSGFGANLLYDNIGPLTQIGVYGMYAYHFNLSRGYYDTKHLSIGLNFGVNQFRLHGDEIYLHDPIDNLVFSNTGSRFLPDAGAGVFYYDDVYYGGVSIPQMLFLNLKIKGAGGDLSNLKRVGHIYAMGGAKYKVGPDDERSRIEPVIWLKYAPKSPLHANASVRYHYNDIFYIGGGYATDNTVMVDLGYTIQDKLMIGYAASYQLSTLSRSLGMNHEIQILYILEDEYE